MHGVQRPGFFLTGVGVGLSIADAVACDLPRHGHERRISPTCSPTVVARWGTGGGFLVPCVLRMVFKNNRPVRRVVRNHRNIPAAKSHTRRKCRADSVLCDRCMNLIAFQKVAKVTLNASQVTTLVSVANAQQADYGVSTPDFKVEDDAGAITTIKGLDALDYLTALKVQRKNGTEYEDTNVTTISELLHSSLTVTDIPAQAIQEKDYCVHVKLPKSFDVLNDELISGKLEDTGNYVTCGSYQLLKGNDGCWYAVLRYDQNYIQQKEEAAAGADTSDAKVTSNVAFNFQWNQSEVTSNGSNLIEVNKDYALDITINPDKTPDEDQKDDKNYDLNQSVTDPRHDGSDAYLDYTVTLVVQNEQAGPLTLADSMTLPTGVTAEYVEDSLRLSMKEDDTTLRITWEDDNGERKITLGSAGSPIAAGTYSIRYTVKLKDVGETAVDGEVINNIRILDTTISDDAEKSVKTDSLVIANQADPSDYELPSTGGAGTKLYTAGGGALMLAALVCGVCRKRRRERRAR